MKILTADKEKEFKTGFKNPKRIQPAAIESLIVTVQHAIQQMSETNARAVELMDSMVLHLGREIPAPIVRLDSPIVNVPPMVFPEYPQYPEHPDPPRQWRVRVSQRDGKGFIQEVDLERIK